MGWAGKEQRGGNEMGWMGEEWGDANEMAWKEKEQKHGVPSC